MAKWIIAYNTCLACHVELLIQIGLKQGKVEDFELLKSKSQFSIGYSSKTLISTSWKKHTALKRLKTQWKNNKKWGKDH